MPIDKFDEDHIWANDGVVTEPSTTKKDLGWVSGEQPSADYFNWLQNQAETKINQIINERLNSFPESLTDPYQIIASNLWTSGNYGETFNSQSYISGGSSKAYVDIATCFDSDNNPIVLALNQAACKIEKWDARTRTNIAISSALTLNLPTADSATWVAVSFCTDNTSVYVLFVDTTNDEFRVQSWKLDTLLVNPAWPTLGTDTLVYGAPAGMKAGTIIVASATKLAVMNSACTVSSAATGVVSIITKATGVHVANGCGDSPVNATEDYGCQIVSDGTNLYFGMWCETLDKICTATIANPQVGTGGTGYPLSAFSGAPMALGAAGGLIISANQQQIGYSHDDVVIRTHLATDARSDSVQLGQSAQDPILDGSTYIFNTPYSICFDGINFWVAMKPVGQPAAVCLLKIDAAKLYAGANGLDNNRSLPDITNSKFQLGQNIEVTMAHPENVKLVFDGRDLWCNVQPDAGATGSGRIYRLPLALIRN